MTSVKLLATKFLNVQYTLCHMVVAMHDYTYLPLHRRRASPPLGCPLLPLSCWHPTEFQP